MSEQSLEADLAELVALLDRHGADRWARILARALARVRARDPVGLDHVLGVYGGMGSINDLWLHPANGHDVAPADVGAVNDRLVALAARVHSRADGLRRELRREEREGRQPD